MERKIKVIGMQQIIPKNPEYRPMYKIHYEYVSNKIQGFGADSVLVTDEFVSRYGITLNEEYLAGVYFDNDYHTHFACVFKEG